MTAGWPVRSISPEDLDAAVADGILSREQALTLARYCAGRAAKTGQADEENLRLISSFNDIFVCIGLLLFTGALFYLLTWTLGLGTTAKWVVMAAVAWGLAEYFTRIKRLALPSIVLMILFAVSALYATAGLFDSRSPLEILFSHGSGMPLLVPSLVTIAAVVVHWFWFHVPITVAAGAAAAVLTVSALFSSGGAGPVFDSRMLVILFVLGLAVFAIAMMFDMQDRARVTRRTDIAFWLHLLAAPLIVHPVVGPLASSGEMTQGGAIAVFAVFIAFSVVALVVDRRALLVSSLGYLIYASTTLLRVTDWETSAIAVAILLVGAMVLMLSAAWRVLRRLLLQALPSFITTRVPVAA